MVEPREGTVTQCFQEARPQPEPGSLPSLEGHLPPFRPASAPQRKCRVSSCCSARLCLGVFTRVTVRVCLDGASRGWTSRAGLTLGEGPGRGARAGCQGLLPCKAQAELLRAGQGNGPRAGTWRRVGGGHSPSAPPPPRKPHEVPLSTSDRAGTARAQGHTCPSTPRPGGQDPGSRLPRGFPQVPRLGKAPAQARRPLPPLSQQRAPEGKALPIQTCF